MLQDKPSAKPAWWQAQLSAPSLELGVKPLLGGSQKLLELPGLALVEAEAACQTSAQVGSCAQRGWTTACRSGCPCSAASRALFFPKGALKPTPTVWGEPSGDDPREWYSIQHLQQLKSDVGGHPGVSDKSGSEEHATCVRKTRACSSQRAQTSALTPSRKNSNSPSRGCLAQHSGVYFCTKSTRTEKTITTQIKKPWRRESPTNLQLNFKDFVWK